MGSILIYLSKTISTEHHTVDLSKTITKIDPSCESTEMYCLSQCESHKRDSLEIEVRRHSKERCVDDPQY